MMPPNTSRPALVILVPTAYLVGGVQVWLDYVVPGLSIAGWDVTVLLVDGEFSDARNYLRHHPFEKFRRVLNRTGSREGRVRALSIALTEIDPDLVLSVNIADAYDAVVRLRKRERSLVRVVMALHGLESCYFRDIERHRDTIDAVVVTNRLAEAVTTQLCGFPRARTKYAPCGVEVPQHARLDATHHDLTIIFAGRLENDEKRVMDIPMIAAVLVRKGVSFRMRIAGSGSAESALRLGLAPYAPNVVFLGVLDTATMRTDVYKPGAILLILSPQETGPLVAWEAMANGVAIVTSQFVGIGREGGLVDGFNCLSFPVGNVTAAAEAILRMRDSALRQLLVANGFDTVKRRYSVAASVSAWNRALVEVLDQPPLAFEAAEAPPPPSGRLDRVLGLGLAETVRQLTGIKYRHTSAGGEWPHSYGVDDNPHFRDALVALDKI